mgnify:CR=1 FL=1
MYEPMIQDSEVQLVGQTKDGEKSHKMKHQTTKKDVPRKAKKSKR